MGCNTVVVQGPGKAEVKIAGIKTVPVILSRDTVSKIAANRPVAVVLTQQTPVDVVEKPTNVKVGGLGIQGLPGAPGGSIAPINFSWGDAPHAVWTAPHAGVLTLVRVDILTPFNGTNPSIKFGTASAPEAGMPAAYNDPTQVAKYQNTADFRVAANDALILDINPGTFPTAGDGTLFLEFLPD